MISEVVDFFSEFTQDGERLQPTDGQCYDQVRFWRRRGGGELSAKELPHRRDDLLDAATAVIVEKGLTGLTVDDVTLRAGVAKGTFYLYFKSKAELAGALHSRFLEGLMARQAAALESVPATDFLGRLETWASELIAGYMVNAHLHDVLLSGGRLTGSYQDSGGTMVDRHIDALTGLLEEGARSGAFRLPVPRATAILLYGALQGTVDYLLHHDGQLPTHQVLSEVRRLCRQVTNA